MAIEKQSAENIHERLSKKDRAVELYKEAVKEGVPMQRYLEMIDDGDSSDKLDAFSRQMKLAGIVTRSDPSSGLWASDAEVFINTDIGRALFPEYAARQWRQVMFQTPQQRAIMLASDAIIGSQELPWVEAGPFWNNQFAPAIPLSEIVATTSPIRGTDYRTIFMTYDAEALRLFRVGESAEIPIANLTTSSREIKLHKYGRGLRTTYEFLRRVTVDKVGWWLRWQALQSEVDKVAAALAVIVSGDGNNNTAATSYNLTTLDANAVVGEGLTLPAWLAFRMKFSNPYSLTTALMQEAVALQLILLNSGSGNVPLMNLNLAGIGNTLVPINTTADGIRYGWTSEAPSNKIVGFDRRFALEMVTEIGSEIQETERFITNQTQVMVMSEVNGFGVLDPSASKILNLGA